MNDVVGIGGTSGVNFRLNSKTSTIQLKDIYKSIMLTIRFSKTPLSHFLQTNKESWKRIVMLFENSKSQEAFLLKEDFEKTLEISRLTEGLIQIIYFPRENNEQDEAFEAISQISEIFENCERLLAVASELRERYEIKETRTKYNNYFDVFNVLKEKIIKEGNPEPEEDDILTSITYICVKAFKNKQSKTHYKRRNNLNFLYKKMKN
jgi:hypothetical protein